MNPRTELRLGAIIGLAVLGTGLLVWGARSGQLQIFGDSFAPRATESIAVATQTAAAAATVVTETFASSALVDAHQTTARWDLDAGNVSLEPGTVLGRVQSLTVAAITGQAVTVSLEVTTTTPTGSKMYYAVSADGGVTWEPIFPGRAVKFSAVTNGDWRWRALLERGAASLHPTLEELELTFVVEEG